LYSSALCVATGGVASAGSSFSTLADGGEVETCKLHGVDPQTYFTDVLTKLVNLWPASRLDELMPWIWAAERSKNKLAA
jgi:hypothetical protein